MRDTLVIALEASWELDPVLMENRLWKELEKDKETCYNISKKNQSVEQVSNTLTKVLYLSMVSDSYS